MGSAIMIQEKAGVVVNEVGGTRCILGVRGHLAWAAIKDAKTQKKKWRDSSTQIGEVGRALSTR